MSDVCDLQVFTSKKDVWISDEIGRVRNGKE